MSNKDIILDSFSRLLTNIRESRTFIHSMAQIRKTYRRTRHSQPPPLSQQLLALQRHYLELCNTIAFTPSSTPPSDSPDPSSPRVWTEKHPTTFFPRNTNTSATAGTPPTEGESRDRRGQYSPLLNEMRWDNDNKQWIGNYTDADKFHNFGTIKPVAEENDSLIAKIAEAADMWYDAKEFKWKKCKKKTKPNQKITTISPPKTLVKPPPDFLPQQQRRGEKEKVQQQQQQEQQEQQNQQPQTYNDIMEEDGGEEEDVFAGISIDVNPVEGDFTRGCFILPQDMCNTFRNAGRRNEEELASWPGKIDVLTQRYNNANIIRRMAIKKILHDITLATVRTSSLSPTTTVAPLQLQPHHVSGATNIINNSQRHYQQSQQQHISMSPITTTSFASGGNTSVSNGESPPLHFTSIYGSQSAQPPSLGNTPTPPPPNSIPLKAATPHRLVLSVRGTKSLTSAKSGSSSAGCLAGGCSSGSSSNTGSKRDSMVVKKFCIESDEDESDPFTDFDDDDNSTSSSSGSYMYKIRHNNDVNGRKPQDGSVGSSVETKVVPLQPKGIRVKKETANTRDNNNNTSGDEDFVFSDENNNSEEIKHRKTATSNGSDDHTSTTNGKNIFLQLRKFNDGNDMDIDNFADFEDNEDVVNDSGSEGDDDDFMGNGNSSMVDNKTRSSSFSRSRSTSLERASQPRIVMKPLKNVSTGANIGGGGGMKLTLRKFANDDDDDVDIDPFKDFDDDDDDDFNNIEESENDTFINGNGAKQVPKIGYSPKDLELPTNLVTSLYKKNNMRYFNNNDDGQPKNNTSKKETKHRKNTHHFATIRQDGTIVMDDENGEEEVYDPYAGFDDSVIVGYEDVFKNNPSECYDDFIDMDDNTDLVLKHRNGGGEFSDEENDEDISGLDLSNVDQLVIHKNTN